MFSKLSIVNACLVAIGNDLVPDLDLPDVDTETAMKFAEEERIKVLSRGWWFNIETDWVMALDSKGEIAIPKTVIDFRTSGESSGTELVRRAGKMYDPVKHTHDLTHIHNGGPIKFEMLVALELEDCPIVAQQHIRDLTVARFLSARDEPQNKIDKADKEALTSLAYMERQHHRNRRANVFDWNKVNAVMAAAGNGGPWGDGILNPLGGRE